MKIALTMLSTLAMLGCSLDGTPRLPSTPSRPADQPAWLWGMVIEDNGICIVGATVKVVGGQALGLSVEQKTPCDAWGYGAGFEFKNLAEGVAMTLRASAPGWAATEVTVVPTSGPQTALLIEPTRLP